MNRLFGINSKELVKEVYFTYLKEVTKAVNSDIVPFQPKLALIMGFRFREISRGAELSKKLGIYNIDEFF